MDLDPARAAHDLVLQGAADEPSPEPDMRLAEHDLRHVFAAREAKDLSWQVRALQPDRVATQPFDEIKGPGDAARRVGPAAAPCSFDRHGAPGRVEGRGELCGAAGDPLRHIIRRDASEKPLGGAPRALDRLFAQIVDDFVVDTVGGAAQGKLAKRRQVAEREEVLGRPPRRIRQIDLALFEALDEFVGRDVDQHDIRRLLNHAIRHSLADEHASNARDDIGQAFKMLDVERGPDVDAGLEQLLHVLPALGMAALRRIGVGEFVHDNQPGLARQRGVEIEFLDRTAAIFDMAARQRLEPFQQGRGLGAAMRLDKANNDVDALGL